MYVTINRSKDNLFSDTEMDVFRKRNGNASLNITAYSLFLRKTKSALFHNGSFGSTDTLSR